MALMMRVLQISGQEMQFTDEINLRLSYCIAVLLLTAIHLALVGWLVNNRPMGVFIDNRNRISLSKLQAGAWTVVVGVVGVVSASATPPAAGARTAASERAPMTQRCRMVT